MISLVTRPRVGKIETVVCRIVRGTTVSGDKRARFVKAGDVVEVDAVTFVTLSGQGQAEKLTPEELTKLAKKKASDDSALKDSAGNDLTVR